MKYRETGTYRVILDGEKMGFGSITYNLFRWNDETNAYDMMPCSSGNQLSRQETIRQWRLTGET